MSSGICPKTFINSVSPKANYFNVIQGLYDNYRKRSNGKKFINDICKLSHKFSKYFLPASMQRCRSFSSACSGT